MKSFLKPKPGNLSDYLERYDLLKNYVIRDLDAIEQTSYNGAKQCFQNGVRLLEIRTSIKAGDYGDVRTAALMKGSSYTAFEELCARVKGFQRAEKQFKGCHRVVLIISFRRQDSEERSLALLRQVLRYRKKIQDRFGQDYIVGVDIAGQEFQYKARQFENVFRKAREQGLKVTAHAGEEQGSGEGSIWQAINSGAQRIGHGTALYLPTPLLPKNVRHEARGFKKNAFILSLMFGTAYEMCLTSNVICGAQVTAGYKPNPDGRPIPVAKVMNRYKDYPGERLLALGSLFYHGRTQVLPLPCTDGLYTLNTDLPREYSLAAKTFGLGLKEILALSRYSLRHSFASSTDRSQSLQAWREFAKAYLTDTQFSSPDEEAKRALHLYRKKLRQRLGIYSVTIEEILQEVHSSQSYLRGYLYERFHQQNERLEV